MQVTTIGLDIAKNVFQGLGPDSPTSPATPNPTGQSPRAAVPVSNACAPLSPTLVVPSLALSVDVVSARSAKGSQARASRKNGAK